MQLVLANLRALPSDIDKYVYIENVHDYNETVGTYQNHAAITLLPSSQTLLSDPLFHPGMLVATLPTLLSALASTQVYHAILCENMEELAPIVYTPTVGDACKQFGYRFNRARGLYLSAMDRGHMHAAVANWPHIDVHVMVVTDGEILVVAEDQTLQTCPRLKPH